MAVNMKCVLKSTLFSLIVTFAMIIIISVIAYFSKAGESTLMVCVYISMAAAVLLGAIAAAKAADRNSFLHSMLMCLMYSTVLLVTSLIINGEISFNKHFLAVIVGVFASGFLGCILGK